MREVSKDEFFAAVGPLDVVPRSGRTETIWEMQHSRRVVGRSTPGYVDSGLQPKRWFLADPEDRP